MGIKTLLFSYFISLSLSGCLQSETQSISDPISGKHHYVNGYDSVSEFGDVKVVVEIPTGTTQKWEVDKVDGKIHWEVKDGKPRIVQYLGYPGNYGMVPRTLLSHDDGGDGDPIDVLVLGPPVDRGRVVNARLIGVLKLLDGGEQDDKLIAVMENTPFYSLNTIEDLRQNFPGVLLIVETWFVSYKGPGKLSSSGYSDASAARSILQKSIEAYERNRAHTSK